MATASMQPIYERLNAVDGYNPLTAETYGDWAMEAGDIVRVVRGTEEYDVPIHSSTLVWRGKHRLSIDATGKKERDSIAKVSAQKYGRGGAAVRSQQGMYQYFESENASMRSEMAMDFASMRIAFENDINSTRSEMRMTSESLRISFTNEINSTRSEMRMTSESLRISFTNEINSTRSEMRMTSESLRISFTNEINSTRSEMRMTSESLRIGFQNEIASTRSEFQATSESLRISFENEISSTRADIQVQANRIGLVVSGTGANARIRPAQIVAAINDSSSEVLLEADKVKISGDTTINDVFTISDGHVAAKVSIFAMPGSVFNGDHVGSFYYSQQEGGYSVQYGILKKAQVDGNTLKIWKFGDSDASPSITFSKATTLTGAVGSGDDGNKYIVTASPQDVNHTVTVSVEIEGTANPNATVYAKSYVVSSSVSKTQIGDAVTMTLGESTSGKYVELYTGSGTSKIQKGKISTTATYNAGWDYGQTQIARTTRAATSQETTIKTLDYNERFTIIDTYTKSNGTTSTIKYIVAAKDVPSATVSAGTWSNGSVTVTAKYGSTTLGSTSVTMPSVTLSGAWSNGQVTVTAKHGTHTAGTNVLNMPSATVSAGTWSNGSVTVTAKHGTATLGSVSVTMPSVTLSDSWANGQVTVTAKHGTHTAGTNIFNMPSATVSAGSWSNGSVTVTAKHGTASLGSTSVTMPSVTLSDSWSNGQVTVTAKHGTHTAGTNIFSMPSATVSAGTWSNGSVTVTAKHGTASLGSTSVTMPSVTLSGTWANGQVTVTAKHGTHTAGTNVLNMPSVTISASSWSNGSATVTAKHGTATVGSGTVSAPSATITFAPTAHDGDGLDDGEFVEPGTLKATAKNGSAELGTNTTELHIGNSSWSSGKMSIAIRLAASNGKVIARKQFTSPSPSLGANTTTKPSGSALKTVTVGTGNNHTYFTISVGGESKGYVDIKY